MDLYIARQPIFDKNMKVVAYELLYRSGMDNYSNVVDGDDATLAVINNAAMNFDTLTNGKPGFINFTHKLICDEIPTLFQSKNIVIEVLEDIIPDDNLIAALKSLRNKGYIIALDDFVYGSKQQSIFNFADIIKVDFRLSTDLEKKKTIHELSNGRIKFLAEKVETIEEFRMAKRLGYTYFQGFFFSKPIMVQSKDVNIITPIFIQIFDEICKDEPNLIRLSTLIGSDLSLSYKLLKLINSASFYNVSKVSSIHQAIVILGLRELKKWITIVMMKDMSKDKPDELLRQSLIRAKLFESIIKQLGMINKTSEAFLVGLFSMINVLVNKPIEEIVNELPLTEEIKNILLGKDVLFNNVLNIVKSYEKAEWNEFGKLCHESKILPQLILGDYYEALVWVTNIMKE